MNDTDTALDTCGCTPATDSPTPVEIVNPPGLPALVWRVGTHGRFLAAQKLRLAAHPSLRALSTREPSDPAIALLDAWSCVLDVLTFHQERFAQENYLRTATERRSILELARAIGYELRPGVAASVALAFTAESMPGAPATIRLDSGLKTQSVPGQDEKPQIFETIETIEARPAWNALRPRLSESSLPLALGDSDIWLEGTATNLLPGDALLILGNERKNNSGSERWDFRRVASLEVFPLSPIAGPNAGRTRVRLDRPLGSFSPSVNPSTAGTEVYALRQRANVFGYNAIDWKALPDLTKKAYLGVAEGTSLTAEQKKEWPAFTVFSRGSSSSADATDPVALAARASAPTSPEPTAEDVRRVATAAAERVARRHEALAKDSVIRAAQGAVNGISSFVKSTTTVLAELGSSVAPAATAIGDTALELANALAALVERNSETKPNLDDASIETLKGLATLPPDTQKYAEALNALKETVGKIAIFLRDPLFRPNFSNENVKAALVAFEKFRALLDPATFLLKAARSQSARDALAEAQTFATSALTAADTVAQAHAAAAAAREAHLVVAAATKAALEGVIPPLSGTTYVSHVAATARDSAAFAVKAVERQDEIGLGLAVGAYPQFAFIPIALYAANQPTAARQLDAAMAVQKAVDDAVTALFASSTPDDSARAIAAPQPGSPSADSDAPYVLDLDLLYPKIVAAGGWLVLSTPDYQEVYRIDSAVESARAEFGLSGKTTRITLGAGENHDHFDNALREVVVYAQSDRLAFASRPITATVSGNDLVLDSLVADLAPGRLLAVTGTDAATGLPTAEIVELRVASATADGLTSLALAAPLVRTYVRDTVFINANVARATHGETKRDEALGSGDGSRPFQSFTLKQKPLTHVSSPLAPGGAAPAIEIRVGGVVWREVPSFLDVGPAERVYTLRRADDGTVTVRFGDGRTGARLPTGLNNVIASYRAGLGLEGQVKADSLTTLLSRPLGAKSVTNPLAAAGAADPEKLADARDNAPLTVLTLDRVVSLRDHEDFARAFAGVGKARADVLWDGERQLVHLTVAAADGTALSPSGDTYKNLRTALDAARHVSRPVVVAPHVPLRFGLSARVATAPDLLRDEVLARIHAALAAAFSFASRGFGQGVAASQIMTVMQNVPGVIAVDLDTIGYVSANNTLAAQNPLTSPNLPARLARRDATGALLGAELLLLSPEQVTLSELPA